MVIDIGPDDRKYVDSFRRVATYAMERGFSGWDPYDAMRSVFLRGLNSNLIRAGFTQLFVHSPINFRSLFTVRGGRNPKGIGLVIAALCRMRTIGFEFDDRILIALADWLGRNFSPGYSGNCWGYNAGWQTGKLFFPRGTPTIVNTSFIAHSLLDLSELTGDGSHADVARSCCDFIVNDLNITEREEGICFSYTPLDSYIVHNANVLGAALLARVGSLTGNNEFLRLAKRAFDFTLHHQEENGLWYYSIDGTTGQMRSQIDWHQGFILDALHDYIAHARPSNDLYERSLLKGAAFYRDHQFLEDGRGKWRYPSVWPIDIHNQAQGIITFSRLSEYDSAFLDFAKTIADWTIERMQEPSGYFAYQKWPRFTNRIPYMRWGQAWMMLALSTLLMVMKSDK